MLRFLIFTLSGVAAGYFLHPDHTVEIPEKIICPPPPVVLPCICSHSVEKQSIETEETEILEDSEEEQIKLIAYMEWLATLSDEQRLKEETQYYETSGTLQPDFKK